MDKDDLKHLEEYTRHRKELYIRIEALDSLIMKLEGKRDGERDLKLKQLTPEFYKVNKHHIPTDAEVMNED